MSTNVSWNSVTYAVPSTGEENWGGTTKVDGLLIALATYGLQRSGGLFTLSADLDFGTANGLKSVYYKSRGTVADAGVFRLAKTESLAWRNNSDNGNNTIATDSSDRLLYNGVVVLSSVGVVAVAAGGTGLTSYSTGDLLYATGSTTLSKLAIGTANKVLTSSGTAPAWNQIVNANVDNAAGITYGKLSLTGAILNADLAGAIVASKFSSGAASSGDILTADGAAGASYVTPAAAPNQSYEITNLGLAASVAGNALTILLKQKDGSTNPGAGTAAVKIGFRDATSATGDFVQRSVTGSLSTVISSGSTAGFTSGTTEFLYVYAIDNGGTGELGWVGGGPILDEGSVNTSTTEGGAGAADSRYTFYSTTGRTSKAIRLIGRLKFSLTTAGTWDKVPDEIYLYSGRLKRDRSQVQVSRGNGHGATNTKIRRFVNTLSNLGTAITYADDSNAGGSFTINEEGIYAVHYTDAQASGGANFGITLNSSQLTTTITSVTDSTLLAFASGDGTNDSITCSVTCRLKPGDVVRAHDEGASMNDTNTYACRLFIAKISE